MAAAKHAEQHPEQDDAAHVPRHGDAGDKKAARDTRRRCTITVEMSGFAKMMQALVAEVGTRPAVVRMLLNLALTEGSQVIPAVPAGADEEEARDALKTVAVRCFPLSVAVALSLLCACVQCFLSRSAR
jgi:hypothetical protein